MSVSVAGEGIVLTFGGLHGTGKSTVAKKLARHYNLKYFSAGQIFREQARDSGENLATYSKTAESDLSIDRVIDERIVELAKIGGVVIDARLGAYLAGDHATLRVYFVTSEDVRVKRIAQREGRVVEEVREEVLTSEKSQDERFKRDHGVKVRAPEIYDCTLNTNKFDVEQISAILISIIDTVLEF